MLPLWLADFNKKSVLVDISTDNRHYILGSLKSFPQALGQGFYLLAKIKPDCG